MTDTGSADAGNSTVETTVPLWTDGLPEELSGLAQAKGWKGTADALTSYKELESFVGHDPNRVLKIPGTDATDEDWSGVHSKLGRPDSADGYAFADLDVATTDTDKAIAERAFKLNLTPAQAAQMRADYYENSRSLVENQETARAAQVQTANEALKGEWGDAFDKNDAFAMDAIEAIGPGFLERAKTLGLLGDLDFRRSLAKFGELLQEDTIEGDGGGDRFAMTPAQAKAEVDVLKMDEKFWGIYMDNEKPGHDAAVAKVQRLMNIAFPAS